MKALVLLPLCYLVEAQFQFEASNDELFFSATYRDFLPSACYFQLENTTLEGIQKAAWDTTSDPSNLGNCAELQANDAWKKLFLSGFIRGHPDFETINQGLIVPRCSQGGVAPGINFPTGSCRVQHGDLAPMLKDFLEPNHAGIPKPVYCQSEPNSQCGKYNNGRSTSSNKFYFDLWYSDDLMYNKRIGQRLRLKESGDNRFIFANGDNDAPDFGTDPNTNFFGPIDRFKRGNSRLLPEDYDPELTGLNPRDAPAWPRTRDGLNDGFWITTEIHTTFEFRNDTSMQFSFSGDDDFWCFIGGRLAVDLQGVHAAFGANLNLLETLSDGNGVEFNIAEELGLEHGEIYTIDIFHAERHTSQSNFVMTTNLFPACNVIQAGTLSFNLADITEGEFEEKFLVTPHVTLNTADNPELTLLSGQRLTSFIYTKTQEAVAQGFDLVFEARVSGGPEGFAIVFQRDTVVDYPISTGSSMNFKGLVNSFAIVLDLCTERDSLETPSSACSGQSVSIHYPENSTLPNSPSLETRRTYDSILRNLKNNESFPIEVIYYGGKPNFLEVYLNQSLYLREDNFQIEEILNGTGSFVGLTATSGNRDAEIFVTNYALKTVKVEPTNSVPLYNSQEFNLSEIVADGEFISDPVSFQTADLCSNFVTSGTLDGFINAVYYQIPGENYTYQEGNNTLISEGAQIFDNEDGTYSLSMSTLSPGQYGLVFTFGEGCIVNVTEGEEGFSPYLQEGSEESCFFQNIPLAVEAFEVQLAPTKAPTALEPQEDDSYVTIISSAAGGVLFFGLLAAIVLLSFRRKWNREKQYVNKGLAYKLETSTTMANSEEYTTTGLRLLESQREINRLQSRGRLDDMRERIDSLQQENENIRHYLSGARGPELPISSPGLPSPRPPRRNRMEF
eukprot:augustus_masked-scaffold_7-processed-gene-12.52-mRNA-1 protein AED:1.00 eAED:1.00 QI:0/-1/0/0/-1/1/1/0/899